MKRLPALLLLAPITLTACTHAGATESQATQLCEDDIKSQLKAPSGAEFELKTKKDTNGWLVTGQVHAQNSFGAMLSSSVICTVLPGEDEPDVEAFLL